MPTAVNDLFEQYYTEKLWEMIPAVYRHEDGKEENTNKGVLRSIIEVMAEQAATLRRSQNRLWDDQFIDLCDSWAVPYIADLLGTRVLSDQNKRGRRIDVAKTIYYRRRNGTPRLLEELISDISEWEGKVVENFRRLARDRHSLDALPKPLAGRFSQTMPGGFADLRRPAASELAGGPFDEYFHIPDFCQHHGQHGIYNIPKLAIHLFRLKSYYVPESTPFPYGDGFRFTFDPSGRDIPLFSKRNRPPDWDEWHSALEWEMPSPIRCRLLGHAEYMISEKAIQDLTQNSTITPGAINEMSGLGVRLFRGEEQLRALISSLSSSVELLSPSKFSLLLRYFIVTDCGKQFLLPNALVKDENGITEAGHGSLCIELPLPDGILTSDQIVSAGLQLWEPVTTGFLDRVFGLPTMRLLAIDPGSGRFMFSANKGSGPACSYHYGFSGRVGAGTYDRRYIDQFALAVTPGKTGGGVLATAEININGILQISDSKTYGPVADGTTVQNMSLVAAGGQRPYLQLTQNWILDTGINTGSVLYLDGLWMGSIPDQNFGVIIRGDYSCVTIKSCTFDPGGDKNVLNQSICPVPIFIEGHIDTLIIESSITGALIVRGSGLVENVCIANSIMQSAAQVIDIESGVVNIERSTILGKVTVHQLFASGTIFFCLPPYGPLSNPVINVADAQSGCFRFSAAPKGCLLPRQYESLTYDYSEESWFTSVRFGDPGYCQLSETAPQLLINGAENGLEMGAFNSLINPVKLQDLKTKIEEYMPFGLIPIFINET